MFSQSKKNPPKTNPLDNPAVKQIAEAIEACRCIKTRDNYAGHTLVTTYKVVIEYDICEVCISCMGISIYNRGSWARIHLANHESDYILSSVRAEHEKRKELDRLAIEERERSQAKEALSGLDKEVSKLRMKKELES